MDSILLSLIIFIPAASGLLIAARKKIMGEDRRAISVFASLAVLLLSIYSLYLFCSRTSSAMPGQNGAVSESTCLFGIINYSIALTLENFIVLTGFSIASFCLSLFPGQYADPRKTALSLFQKTGISGLVLSRTIPMMAAFTLIFLVSFHLATAVNEGKGVGKWLIPAASALTMLASAALFQRLPDEAGRTAALLVLALSAIVLSGIPFADGWLTGIRLESGDDIFASVSAGKIGLVLLAKLTTLLGTGLAGLSVPVMTVIFAAAIMKAVETGRSGGLEKTFTGYSIMTGYMLIAALTVPSVIISTIAPTAIFALTITSSALLFCSSAIRRNSGGSEDYRIGKGSQTALMLILTCATALFVPGTAGFIPYSLILISSLDTMSVAAAIFLITIPMAAEILMFLSISPMIFKKGEIAPAAEDLSPSERPGILLLLFCSFSAGVFPAIMISPNEIMTLLLQ